MEESSQEIHLELTKKDKTFVRELIKIHLGVNLTTEEDYDDSILDSNSYVITKEDDSESEIEVMKRTLIEEVFNQYLKKNCHEPVRQLPFEESDINSNNIKVVNCNERILENTVDLHKNKNVFEIVKKKQSDMSQEVPFTPNQDYFVNDKAEEKVKPDFSNCFYSENPSAQFTTLPDKSEDGLMIEEQNYNDTFEQCEKSSESDISTLMKDKQLSTSNFEVTSPNSGNYSCTSELVPAHTSSITKPYIKNKIFSHYQKRLKNNEINPTACLYELCNKLKWPKPLFSCYDQGKNSSFMFDVCVKNLSIQGQKWTQNKTSAKLCASIACLRYLGFECPIKEENASFITNKGMFKPIVTELNGKINKMHRNSKQDTDKKEENNSSKNYTDLRLILETKRSMKKNLSTTENSSLGNHYDISLM